MLSYPLSPTYPFVVASCFSLCECYYLQCFVSDAEFKREWKWVKGRHSMRQIKIYTFDTIHWASRVFWHNNSNCIEFALVIFFQVISVPQSFIIQICILYSVNLSIGAKYQTNCFTYGKIGEEFERFLSHFFAC